MGGVRFPVLFGSVLACIARVACAQEAVEPFDSFVAHLHTIQPAAIGPRTAVPDAASVDQARSYLLAYYGGLQVRQSLRDADGRILDCVRYDQQPALRLQSQHELSAPPAFAPPTARPASMPTQHAYCAAGTFPIQRMTLGRVMRAGSLRDFFRKAPDGIAPNFGGHAYSFAYQKVKNFGGTSTESLYSPKIDSQNGEIFSLEQQWYIGGGGAKTQTAELGWQDYPGLYNTHKSVLFTYFTADDYQNTGCYNYDCGAFVQSSGSPVTLGMPFASYSVAGGKQVPITIGYTLTDGKWWVSFGGSWVGYYPVSVYDGGQLSKHATLFELGTETVGSTVWPPAASGQFASAGYPNAGYQFDVGLLNAKGHTFTPKLTADQPSPTCYTTTTPGQIASHGYGFLLGGPGGTGC